MNFTETGFREFYNHFCALELNDKLKAIVKQCPYADTATHVLVYGYIDEDFGLMLEVIAVLVVDDGYTYFKEPYVGKRISISIMDVLDVNFIYYEKLDDKVMQAYQPRIDALNIYKPSKEVEETRSFCFLDLCRNIRYPDDIKVRLIKRGLKIEERWVRLKKLGSDCLYGELLEQPQQDFGCNKGDVVEFYVNDEHGQIFCCSHFDDAEEIEEELKNGDYLKQTLIDFNNNRNKDTFSMVLYILRNVNVILPCSFALKKEITEIYNRTNGDPDVMSEEEAKTFYDGALIMPKLLTNHKEDYIPVFSSEDEVKNFDDSHTLKISFIRAMVVAMMSNLDFDGIVVNPYTDSFIIKKADFETIMEIKAFKNIDKDVLKDKSVTVVRKNVVEQFNNSGIEIEINVDKIDMFNYALYQNQILPISGISIYNQSEETIQGASLHIKSDFEFFKEYETSLSPIPIGSSITIEDPQLTINSNKLAEMDESVNAQIIISITKDGVELCGLKTIIQVFAYDQWHGADSYQELLASFVLPNHPLIPSLVHDASNRLKMWGKPSSIEGYQSHNPNRVRDLATAMFVEIQKKNIAYSNPPASFSIPGQRIRTPEVIMEQRLGTCLDMSLLYASCLEAMGLHPLIVLLKRHAFVGIWLRERSNMELLSSNIIIDDMNQLTKRIDHGSDELTFVECTSLNNSDKMNNFYQAEYMAKTLHFNDKEEFEGAIDIQIARMHGIKPMVSRTKNDSKYQIEVEEIDEKQLGGAPQDLNINHEGLEVTHSHKINNKRELWESKLLDLSLRNILLNLPKNDSVLPIMSSHIDELEDALADGHEFYLLPIPSWISDIVCIDTKSEESKPKSWLNEVVQQNGIYEIVKWPTDININIEEKIRQEYRNHRLYSFDTSNSLERALTHIYRNARFSQQENGVSSLYLAVGLLKYYPKDDQDKLCYAPLILLPIEIIRKSANRGYALHARDEEPHFNTTLLELLKQQFSIVISGLDPLPCDEHGIDLKKCFNIIRKALYGFANWDVVESCVIGNFSFARFAMWNDLHSAKDILENSKIVSSLMKGYVDFEINNNENSDEITYLPIPVDASQLKAIQMANRSTSFVLHGPPGTGKSQTITAMIANLLAHGKTVLFVAEKMAALSVVQKRLTSLGIDDFCLELHSDKANKKQVLSQLNKALMVKCPPKSNEYDELLAKINRTRKELDEYGMHLHLIQYCGYSLRDLIDMYELVADNQDMIIFDNEKVLNYDRNTINAHIPLIKQLIAAIKLVNINSNNPLFSVHIDSYNAMIRTSLIPYCNKYLESLTRIIEECGEIATLFNYDEISSREDLQTIAKLVKLYLFKEQMGSSIQELLDLGYEDAYEYFDYETSVKAKEEELLKIWDKSFLSLDMDEYLSKYYEAGNRFFGKGKAKAAFVASIQPYAKQMLNYENSYQLLLEVSKYQANKDACKDSYDSLIKPLQSLINKYPSKDKYHEAYDKALMFKEDAKAFGGMTYIFRLPSMIEHYQLLEAFTNDINKLWEDENDLNQLLCRSNINNDNWMKQEMEFCEYLINHPSSLKDWGVYNKARNECLKVGLEEVVEALEKDSIKTDLVIAYQKGLYYAMINKIIANDDVLCSFSGVTFNESIRQFKEIDEMMLKYNKDEIYYQLSSRLPNPLDSIDVGKELNYLRKAIGSNGRGISIRILFKRISHIIKSLCPCMLMSPNSVAQYLAQDNNLFDVVIFDEASQLPTCKAIGALSRAHNAIIVGDPKQMPPTSFFMGSGPEVEDLALDDLDSILDDALALGIPSQYLKWHYRSTHESLIAFSNDHFYDNKMYTFPSANDRETHVSLIHVDGIYDKGINEIEANAVVDEIIRRFNDPILKKQSIGVVTFNIKQQALIENLLNKKYLKNAALDRWANSGEDPIFIKNLENVQGDERDVILFSIGYGPDQDGRISMNFGPINKEGGGKRLNVAFSRARVTMMVFASMDASDIRITANSSQGVIAFHDFLKYAQGHELVTKSSEEINEKLGKAGILNNICEVISDNGYTYQTMVGHSDFRIDIAIIDPYDPTKYILGILLDGDGYKQTSYTRDREVSQINVLSNLGWKIKRIWTIDYWDNSDKVLQDLFKDLDELKAISKEKYDQQQEISQDEEVNQEESIEEIQDSNDIEETSGLKATMITQEDDSKVDLVNNPTYILEDYVSAELELVKLSSTDLADSKNKAMIIERMKMIVEIEGPILKDSLFKRLLASYGLKQTSQNAEILNKIIKSAKLKSTRYKGISCYWASNQDPLTYQGIRISSKRNGEEIPIQELVNATCYVLTQDKALGKEALIKEIARSFGYKRVGKNLEVIITNAIQYCKRNGTITLNDEGKYVLV